MAYGQIDFERVADDRGKSRMYVDDEPTVVAALRIAAAVMRPGVIEEALDSFDDLVSPEAIAEIIRAALTESHDGN